jgi:hypothetical protein
MKRKMCSSVGHESVLSTTWRKERKEDVWKVDFQLTQLHSHIKNVYSTKWITCFSLLYSRHLSGLACKNIRGTCYFTSVVYM